MRPQPLQDSKTQCALADRSDVPGGHAAVFLELTGWPAKTPTSAEAVLVTLLFRASPPMTRRAIIATHIVCRTFLPSQISAPSFAGVLAAHSLLT